MENFYLVQEILNEFDNINNKFDLAKTKFVNHLKQININDLNKEQLINFTNDIKQVIEPIKNSIDSIEFLINNKDFLNNESVITNNNLK